MAKATLMVFILDQLPGFSDVLNLTFDVLTRSHPDMFVSHPQYCDPTLAEPILGVVNQQFMKADPSYKNNIVPIHQEIDLSAYDVNLDAINYAKHLKEMEISKSSQPNQLTLFELANSFNDKNIDISNIVDNYTVKPQIVPVRLQNVQNESKSFDDVVPYLVAIFETLSNVTAQTCGGVVMAPKWVLTSADCLNMLKDFNIAGIKEKDTSIYSTIVGAKNPLEDGKVYNVTDIFIYPNLTKIDSQSCRDQCKTEFRNKVALMKIRRNYDAAINLNPLGLVSEGYVPGNVTVVGWSMLNGSASNDIHPAFVSGTVSKCKLDEAAPNRTELCLDVTEDITTKITPGGPVLVHQDNESQLLGLLTAAEDRPYTVTQLSVCRSWITAVMNHQ